MHCIKAQVSTNMVTTAFVLLEIFRAPTFFLTSLAHKTSSIIQRIVQKFLVEIACWLDFKAALAPPLLRFTTALATGLLVVVILSHVFNAMTCLTGMTSLAAHMRIPVFRIMQLRNRESVRLQPEFADVAEFCLVRLVANTAQLRVPCHFLGVGVIGVALNARSASVATPYALFFQLRVVAFEFCQRLCF